MLFKRGEELKKFVWIDRGKLNEIKSGFELSEELMMPKKNTERKAFTRSWDIYKLPVPGSKERVSFLDWMEGHHPKDINGARGALRCPQCGTKSYLPQHIKMCWILPNMVDDWMSHFPPGHTISKEKAMNLWFYYPHRHDVRFVLGYLHHQIQVIDEKYEQGAKHIWKNTKQLDYYFDRMGAHCTTEKRTDEKKYWVTVEALEDLYSRVGMEITRGMFTHYKQEANLSDIELLYMYKLIHDGQMAIQASRDLPRHPTQVSV